MSKEQVSGEKPYDRQLAAAVAAGLITLVFLQGSDSNVERRERDKQHHKKAATHKKQQSKITTRTPAQIQKFEKVFDCQIQTQEAQPTAKQLKCIQYVASLVGENTFEWRRQDDCLEDLWTRESNWNLHADNPVSTAYGIPQALKSKHEATLPQNYDTNAVAQVQWGLEYIHDRYDTPCKALGFWHRQDEIGGANWY